MWTLYKLKIKKDQSQTCNLYARGKSGFIHPLHIIHTPQRRGYLGSSLHGPVNALWVPDLPQWNPSTILNHPFLQGKFLHSHQDQPGINYPYILILFLIHSIFILHVRRIWTAFNWIIAHYKSMYVYNVTCRSSLPCKAYLRAKPEMLEHTQDRPSVPPQELWKYHNKKMKILQILFIFFQRRRKLMI